MIRYACLGLLLAVLLQTATASNQLRLVVWNVENLFDCQDDSLRLDEEFLPTSPRRWTPARYWRKVQDVARVLMALGQDRPPELVALCEVENDSVMRDLTQRSLLRSLGYHHVMTSGSDPRGINVALLYQPSRFRLLGSRSLRVPSESHGHSPTRDVLYAWGIIPGGDTLHLAVCHLPSRRGAKPRAKAHRQLAAHLIRTLTDSLGAERLVAVAGDFNAPPHDPLFRLFGGLHDLAPQKRRPHLGTYRFQGEWQWIDHVLVSPPLLRRCTLPVLFTEPWVMQPLGEGPDFQPRRTYAGPNYLGGVSDHLAFYIDIE